MNKTTISLNFLKPLIPRHWKRGLKEARMARQFRKALRKVAELPPGETPTAVLLAALRLGWANDGYSSKVDYLNEQTQEQIQQQKLRPAPSMHLP